MTFDRHPASVVRPESAPKLLTDLDQKLELLAATGIDATIVIHFDETQSREEPAIRAAGAGRLPRRVDRRRRRGLPFRPRPRRQRRAVAQARRRGQLRGAAAGARAAARRRRRVDQLDSDPPGLAGGQVELAAELLGRPFEARGVVVVGDQRGRLLGFPTANVEVPNAVCVPADGVYAGWYERPNGEVHQCALNLGRRPTFYEHADHSLLEAHLLDFEGDIYGERAEVRFTTSCAANASSTASTP